MFADLTDLNAPGVYFLFGRDDSTWRQFIYIGEGDDVRKRLAQPHTFEKDGSYWFLLYTCGNPSGGYVKSITKTLEPNGTKVMGSYGCRGYDTYDPFKRDDTVGIQ